MKKWKQNESAPLTLFKPYQRAMFPTQMVGQWICYDQIRSQYQGDDEPPRSILHRGSLVLALCISANRHPRIYSTPAEVWVEAGSPDEEWGSILAFDSGAVPVYASWGNRVEFRELGIYHVIDSTSEPVALAQRVACPGIPRLSRVVFLSGPHN